MNGSIPQSILTIALRNVPHGIGKIRNYLVPKGSKPPKIDKYTYEGII
jgi:hypothetical protein